MNVYDEECMRKVFYRSTKAKGGMAKSRWEKGVKDEENISGGYGWSPC